MIENDRFLNYVFVCLEERQSTRQALSFNRTNTEGDCIENLEDTLKERRHCTHLEEKISNKKQPEKPLVLIPTPG